MQGGATVFDKPYILLKDKEHAEKATRLLGVPVPRQIHTTPCRVLKGELVIAIPPEDRVQQNDGLMPHNYRTLTKDSPATFYHDDEELDLSPLTPNDYDVLAGIKLAYARYQFFIEEGRLDWANKLKKGDKVFVELPVEGGGATPGTGPRASAVVRYVGPVQTLSGIIFGVEIKDRTYFGWGTSDGIFQDEQHFRCREDCGLFVSAEKLFPAGTVPAGTPHPAQRGGGKQGPHMESIVDPHSSYRYKVGDRVAVFTKKGVAVHGTVKWVGMYSFIVNKKDYSHKSVGIETDVKVKANEVEGFPAKPYFTTAKDRGAVYLSEGAVLPEVDLVEGRAPVQDHPVDLKRKNLLREADPEYVPERGKSAALAKEAGIKTELVRQDAAARRQIEHMRKGEEEERRQEEMEVRQAVPDQSLNVSGQEERLRQIAEERRRVEEQISGGRDGKTGGEGRGRRGGGLNGREREMGYERKEGGHVPQNEHTYDILPGEHKEDVVQRNPRHNQFQDKRYPPPTQFNPATESRQYWDSRNGSHHQPLPAAASSQPGLHESTGSSYPHPASSQSADQLGVAAGLGQPPGQHIAYAGPPGQPSPALGVGSPVQLVGDPNRHGVVKWLGPLPEARGLIAGVELDEPMEGCGDGEWKGRRYFTCLPGRAFFCPVSSLRPDPWIPPATQPVHSSVQGDPQQVALQVTRYQKSKGLPIESAVREAGLLISDIMETGTTLGTGSYGKVIEVKVRGRRCAAKKLHGVFVAQDVPPKEKSAITERFETECRRVLYLSHPNIIEMIGIHFDRATRLPTLVMELMDTSLCKYLENNAALSTKYSILHDVASGLVYLHSLPPPLGPIVHRDLTANNILLALSRGMVAKIADLGQAKIDSKYATRQQQLSQVPGNDDHMPPEAWLDNPVYNSSLDVFSFGVVMLHTLTHEWPKPLGRFKTSTAVRLEVDRRKDYLDKISSSPLKPLVVQCLSQEPGDRPTTTDIFHVLERHINRFHGSHRGKNPLKDVPTWEEEDQTIAGDQIQKYTGDKRGIQGHQNSCYLDATIFGLFALSDVFDSLFLVNLKSITHTSLQSPTAVAPIQTEIGDMLWKGIVNPLRKYGVVKFESVMQLRNKLEQLGKMEGVNTKEKDPEEFLNMLFKHTLHVDPFIHIKRPSGTEPDFFVQLFVELDKSLKVPTIEALLRNMFKEQHISFSEVPSKLLVLVPKYGKQFQRIIPEITLDTSPLLDTPKKCFICNEAAQVNCQECGTFFCLNNSRLCDRCSGLVHKHPARVAHKPKKREDVPELELLSVLCIETSHYVCFSRDNDGRWLFFDSMADRLYDQFNIPRGVECTSQLNEWVYEGDQERLMAAGPRELPELVRRFTQDVYMCVYIQPDYGMYG